MERIICIAGPTASGKTELAVALAEALNGEVLSCDSMQVYRSMDIGTAKPTPEERRGIVHHMLDVAEPWESYSVGQYVAQAEPILQSILRRGKTALVAGGTGLYMDALIRGNAFAPCPSTGVREALEAQARQQGIAPLLERLRAVDPESAARLHPSDEKRILRALEVYLETGKTITQHNRETQALPPRHEAVWIGLDYVNRSTLYARIDLRVDRMLEAGLLREIQGLLARGVPDSATALQAIGYKEPLAALRGQCTMEQAVAQIKQSSRRYAKRQLTWFRRNPGMNWLPRGDEENFSSIYSRAVGVIPFFDR